MGRPISICIVTGAAKMPDDDGLCFGWKAAHYALETTYPKNHAKAACIQMLCGQCCLTPVSHLRTFFFD